MHLFPYATARWRTLAPIGATTLLLMLLLSSVTSAATACRRVKGQLTVEPLTGPACPSPIGYCTLVTYEGSLKGTALFKGTGQVVTADSPTTGVILITGDREIPTKAGSLVTKDALLLQTPEGSNFSEMQTIIGGTGEWVGASGTLQALGTGGSGEYTGEICMQ